MPSADVEIATTIANQLGGTGRLQLMIGARHFLASKTGLNFQFPRPGAGKPNFVRINLDPSDTYTVEFGSFHGSSIKILAKFSDIYADGLIDLFERTTGLVLRMPKVRMMVR